MRAARSAGRSIGMWPWRRNRNSASWAFRSKVQGSELRKCGRTSAFTDNDSRSSFVYVIEVNKIKLTANSTIYCTGCNERFAYVAGDVMCPRCGVELEFRGPNPFGETLLTRSSGTGSTGPKSGPSPDPTEVDQLIGRDLHVYHCQSVLGAGGMGRVYLAHHKDLQRQCALKILSPEHAGGDSEFLARFLQEGRAAAALIHPNIVTTHAIGIAEGYHFLEMEFVPGRSLQNLLDDEGPQTPTFSTAITARIADGLAAAHRSGIVHRDLKLDNVLMTHRGVPKIADFGLAKRIAANGQRDSTDHWLCGTPNFMAPELFQGSPATTGSDVYALGVCYFLLLTGGVPFVGGSLDALRRAITEDPLPKVRELTEGVTLEMAECLSLLLAKSPLNRPRDAIEASQLLYAVLGQVRDVESLLKEAFQDTEGILWTRSNDRYELDMSLPDGRRQTLFVESSPHSASERLLLIYSLCCDARPEYYEDALRLNSEMLHGALAIREVDGTPTFVVIDTYPRATVDPEEIRRSVLEVAFQADAVENRLTGLDHH